MSQKHQDDVNTPFLMKLLYAESKNNFFVNKICHVFRKLNFRVLCIYKLKQKTKTIYNMFSNEVYVIVRAPMS